MAVTAASSLNSTDTFLQLLVAQLQNQDPLSPTDSTQFVTQLATFTQVQEQQKQTASFADLLKVQQLSQGTSLIGKTVQYTTASGAAQSGSVSAVAVKDGAVQLAIGTDRVALSQVTNVTA